MIDLNQRFDDRISRIEKLILAYPIENRRAYGLWLNQQYFLVENSTRYLAFSASKVSTRDRATFKEWIHHLEEETDHDLFVLKDLKKIGWPFADAVHPVTRAIVATQYFDIQTYGPNALLGYALMLEGLSCRVCAPLADRVEKSLGSGTATYLRLHAAVDQDHFPEGLKKIATLDEEQARIVAMNLDTMTDLYAQLLTDLARQAMEAVELGTEIPALSI